MLRCKPFTDSVMECPTPRTPPRHHRPQRLCVQVGVITLEGGGECEPMRCRVNVGECRRQVGERRGSFGPQVLLLRHLAGTLLIAQLRLASLSLQLGLMLLWSLLILASASQHLGLVGGRFFCLESFLVGGGFRRSKRDRAAGTRIQWSSESSSTADGHRCWGWCASDAVVALGELAKGDLDSHTAEVLHACSDCSSVMCCWFNLLACRDRHQCRVRTARAQRVGRGA